MVKRNVIFLSVLVLTTMLVGIGVSYSLWNISTSQDTTNIAETKCFDLSITNQENNISQNNSDNSVITNDKQAEEDSTKTDQDANNIQLPNSNNIEGVE